MHKWGREAHKWIKTVREDPSYNTVKIMELQASGHSRLNMQDMGKLMELHSAMKDLWAVGLQFLFSLQARTWYILLVGDVDNFLIKDEVMQG